MMLWISPLMQFTLRMGATRDHTHASSTRNGHRRLDGTAATRRSTYALSCIPAHTSLPARAERCRASPALVAVGRGSRRPLSWLRFPLSGAPTSQQQQQQRDSPDRLSPAVARRLFDEPISLKESNKTIS